MLRDTKTLAPQLEQFFIGLKPVIDAAPNGFPSLRKFLNQDLPPLLGRLDPFFAELDPLLQDLALYKKDITAFVANAAAVTNAQGAGPETGNRAVKYLRTSVPLGPDSVAVYPNRLKVNRGNPYVKPLGYLEARVRRPQVLRDLAVRQRDQRDLPRVERADPGRAGELHRLDQPGPGPL